MIECKHCNKVAVWRWDDADGNEHSYICQRCLETLSFYKDANLWQLTHIASSPVPFSLNA